MLTYNQNRREFSGVASREELHDRMSVLRERYGQLNEQSWIRGREHDKRQAQAEYIAQQIEDLRPVIIAYHNGEQRHGSVEFE